MTDEARKAVRTKAGTCVRILLAMARPWTQTRLWMVIIGVSVVQALFWTGVYYLYSFAAMPEKIQQFYFDMYDAAQKAVVYMVLGYLGLQTGQNVVGMFKGGPNIRETSATDPQ